MYQGEYRPLDKCERCGKSGTLDGKCIACRAIVLPPQRTKPCVHCGSPLPSAEWTTCPYCGVKQSTQPLKPEQDEDDSEIVEILQCPECGATVGDADTSCPKCSAEFELEGIAKDGAGSGNGEKGTIEDILAELGAAPKGQEAAPLGANLPAYTIYPLQAPNWNALTIKYIDEEGNVRYEHVTVYSDKNSGFCLVNKAATEDGEPFVSKLGITAQEIIDAYRKHFGEPNTAPVKGALEEQVAGADGADSAEESTEVDILPYPQTHPTSADFEPKIGENRLQILLPGGAGKVYAYVTVRQGIGGIRVALDREYGPFIKQIQEELPKVPTQEIIDAYRNHFGEPDILNFWYQESDESPQIRVVWDTKTNRFIHRADGTPVPKNYQEYLLRNGAEVLLREQSARIIDLETRLAGQPAPAEGTAPKEDFVLLPDDANSASVEKPVAPSQTPNVSYHGSFWNRYVRVTTPPATPDGKPIEQNYFVTGGKVFDDKTHKPVDRNAMPTDLYERIIAVWNAKGKPTTPKK